MAKRETGAERRQRESRHFLVDLNYEEGQRFCQELLNTGDFGTTLITRHVPKESKGQKKQAMATDLAYAIVNGDLAAEPVVRDYAKQSRMWLALPSHFSLLIRRCMGSIGGRE